MVKRTRFLISDSYPESPRWRASLIQNVNVVENLCPINDDETDTGKFAQRTHREISVIAALSRRGHRPAGPQSRHSYNQITTGGVAWGAASALAQILALAWVEE